MGETGQTEHRALFFQKAQQRRGLQTRGCSSQTCHSEKRLTNMSIYGHLGEGAKLQHGKLSKSGFVILNFLKLDFLNYIMTPEISIEHFISFCSNPTG